MRITKKDMLNEYHEIMGYAIPQLRKQLNPVQNQTLDFKLDNIKVCPKEDWTAKEIKGKLEELKGIVNQYL